MAKLYIARAGQWEVPLSAVAGPTPAQIPLRKASLHYSFIGTSSCFTPFTQRVPWLAYLKWTLLWLSWGHDVEDIMGIGFLGLIKQCPFLPGNTEAPSFRVCTAALYSR